MGNHLFYQDLWHVATCDSSLVAWGVARYKYNYLAPPLRYLWMLLRTHWWSQILLFKISLYQCPRHNLRLYISGMGHWWYFMFVSSPFVRGWSTWLIAFDLLFSLTAYSFVISMLWLVSGNCHEGRKNRIWYLHYLGVAIESWLYSLLVKNHCIRGWKPN